MNAPRTIPGDVLAHQIKASDPAVSAWVAANAGSGKTHVLAQRVIRLLLEGVLPEKILCITFTKAAAANMAKRVFDTLARWTALDDTALDQAIVATAASLLMPISARRRGACSPRRSRRRAGSRCRPSMHSAPGCCTSFRSRPMWRRASKCSIR